MMLLNQLMSCITTTYVIGKKLFRPKSRRRFANFWVNAIIPPPALFQTLNSILKSLILPRVYPDKLVAVNEPLIIHKIPLCPLPNYLIFYLNLDSLFDRSVTCLYWYTDLDTAKLC